MLRQAARRQTTQSGSRFTATLCQSPRFASQSRRRLRSAESHPNASFSACSAISVPMTRGTLREHAVALADLTRQVRLVDAIEVVQHELADAARREAPREFQTLWSLSQW
jgi:hypothetical protein